MTFFYQHYPVKACTTTNLNCNYKGKGAWWNNLIPLLFRSRYVNDA